MTIIPMIRALEQDPEKVFERGPISIWRDPMRRQSDPIAAYLHIGHGDERDTVVPMTEDDVDALWRALLRLQKGDQPITLARPLIELVDIQEKL